MPLGPGSLLGAAMLAACLAASPPAAAVTADAALENARHLAAVDPHRGLAALRELRAGTAGQADLTRRWRIDEIECRLLGDLDASQGLRVADAGLALDAATPSLAAQEARLRLRVCRVGALIQARRIAEAEAELEAIAAKARAPGLEIVAALVRVERGHHRTRSGRYDEAQADLIAACRELDDRGARREADLCLGALATHYQRVGDIDESLRLLQPLRDAARAAGELYDESIHLFGIAQALGALERWPEALESYGQAAQASERLADETGLAYAEHGMALARLRTGAPLQALALVEQALARLPRANDERQHETASLTRAEALAALGRAREALAVLDDLGPALRDRSERQKLSQALSVRATALEQLGRWQEAYAALAEARTLERTLHRQQLSGQSARLRMQFNRERDAEEVNTLRRLNEQGQRLRQTQTVAIGLFLVVLAGSLGYLWRKFGQVRQLQNLAATDELTGLPNRRAVTAVAAQALQAARDGAAPMAVLMIDIDHFKRVNDSRGHAVGDAVLVHAARRLASVLRQADTLGRIGGEEFVAILPGAGPDAALQVAERMRAAIEAAPAPTTDGAPVAFTVSIGVACGADVPALDTLLRLADAALYQAKAEGRNRVVVARSSPPEWPPNGLQPGAATAAGAP